MEDEKKETTQEKPQLLKQINEALKTFKEENERREELLRREEEIIANKHLYGNSEAGVEIKQLTEEEKRKEEAKSFFSGTEVEQALAKYG